jgi:hypothetical protein
MSAHGDDIRLFRYQISDIRLLRARYGFFSLVPYWQVNEFVYGCRKIIVKMSSKYVLGTEVKSSGFIKL